MTRTLPRVRLALLAAVAAAVACSEGTTSPLASDAAALSTAFTTTLLGSSATASSFGGSDSAWAPAGDDSSGGGHRGHGHGGFGDGARGLGGGDLMGGGLGPDFFGGIGFGRGFGHGPFGGSALPTTCTFASGRVTCAAATVNGITTTRSAAYTTAAGTAQQAPDSTTNTVNLSVAVSGTRVHADGDTTTVSLASDRTVTGLASTSTQRTTNGTSAGTERTVGTNATNGAFVAVRTMGDTVSGVVTPVVSGRPTYPTAGTVIRAMSATITYAGGTPTTTTRREVLTYDGTTTAKVVVTQDGTTKTCTLPLPHGRMTCS